MEMKFPNHNQQSTEKDEYGEETAFIEKLPDKFGKAKTSERRNLVLIISHITLIVGVISATVYFTVFYDKYSPRRETWEEDDDGESIGEFGYLLQTPASTQSPDLIAPLTLSPILTVSNTTLTAKTTTFPNTELMLTSGLQTEPKTSPSTLTTTTSMKTKPRRPKPSTTPTTTITIKTTTTPQKPKTTSTAAETTPTITTEITSMTLPSPTKKKSVTTTEMPTYTTTTSTTPATTPTTTATKVILTPALKTMLTIRNPTSAAVTPFPLSTATTTPKPKKTKKPKKPKKKKTKRIQSPKNETVLDN